MSKAESDQGFVPPGAASRRAVDAPSSGWSPFRLEAITTVHGAFERQAASTPDAVSVVGPNRSVTYAELDDRASLAAASLVAHGAPGRPIALAMAHDVDLVIATFAVLKSGGVVLILDPEAPEAVNRAILADARPAALVTDDLVARSVAGDDGAPRMLWADLDGSGSAEPLEPVGLGSPAMLAYSSGTTGSAKAAVIPHRALLQLFRGAIDTLRIGPADRLPMIFPISLAVAAYPMFLPLMVGGSLRIRDVRSLGLAGFHEWLASEHISVLYVSPTVVRFMTDGPDDLDLGALRLVVLGGERVDGDAIDIVRRVFGPQATIANGYGTTETGVLTFFVVGDGEVFGPNGVPVGFPIADTELRILDDGGGQVPAGVAGDLFVRSRHLFSGYWGRPDLDAAVLSEEAGAPVYRTGDVGYLDEAGSLVLVGRSDAEIKVRGHRVQPGEVEQALLALPEVIDAVVEGRPDSRGTNELVAWVVPAEGQELTTIRAAIRASVRGPLVPARLVLLDALPQLPNGKLDRRALPDPTEARRRDEVPAPETPTEGRLVAIWEEVLDVRPLGIDEDLVDLGAASFDLAWALVLIEERHGVRVPMAAMLDARTITDLAIVVDELQGSDGAPPTLVEVQRGAADRPRLFVVHDLHGTSYSLRYLAPALGEDQPVWGFESPFLEGHDHLAETLEELAARYVGSLVAVQPEGPYHLAGYSFGGVLAFEIARQLAGSGRSVGFLGIVDVGPGYRGRHYNPRKMLDKPWSRIPMPPDPSLPTSEKVAWYRDLARRSPKDFGYHLSLRTGADRWLDPLQFRWDLRRGGVVPARRRLWYAWRSHWELARRYRWEGKRFPGSLLLLWAAESAAADGTMGWGSVIDGDIEIAHVDIPHERMLQPEESAIVGRELRRGLDGSLAQAQEESSTEARAI